jgi:hypothetical protein
VTYFGAVVAACCCLLVARATPAAPPKPTAPATGGRSSVVKPSEVDKLADSATNLLIAAVEFLPLPAELPVEDPPSAPFPSDRYLVEGDGPPLDIAKAEMVLFSMDFFIFLGPNDKDALRAIVVRTRNGLRLVSLTAPDYVGTRPAAMPPSLDAATREVGAKIHDAIRARRVSALLLSEADRAAVRSEEMFTIMKRLLPDARAIQKAEARVAAAGAPTSYRLMQLGWLAHAESDEFFGFEMKVNGERDDRPAFGSNPLVRSRLIGKPAPGPGPGPNPGRSRR